MAKIVKTERKTQYGDPYTEESREIENRRQREAWYVGNCPFGIFKCNECPKYSSCKMKGYKEEDHA